MTSAVEKNVLQAYSPCMDFEFHHYEVLDSTMNAARSLAKANNRVSHIIMADFQTSGKGRLEGRKWIARAGHSLLMTLVVRGKANVQASPLRVGLAALEVLARLPRDRSTREQVSPLALKWPNDLLGVSLGKAGKLGGILCEAAGDTLLAGIGINLTRHAYPAELGEFSTSIEETGIIAPEAGSRSGLERLARDIAVQVVSRLENDDWQGSYTKALWAIGGHIRFNIGHPSRGEIMSGTMEGIDAEGCLRVRDELGIIHTYASGEISSLG